MKDGSVIVGGFKIFESYMKRDILTYEGNWDEYKGNATEFALHSFLITGIHKTDDGSGGGIMLEVQDSLIDRPFINIGLDLLRTMGIASLSYISSNDVDFNSDRAQNALLYEAGKHLYAFMSGTLSTATSSSRAHSSSIASHFDRKKVGSVDDRNQVEKRDWVGFEVPAGVDTADFATIT